MKKIILIFIIILLTGCSQKETFQEHYNIYHDNFKNALMFNKGLEELPNAWLNVSLYKYDMPKEFKDEILWEKTISEIDNLINKVSLTKNITESKEILNEIRIKWKLMLNRNEIYSREYYVSDFIDIKNLVYDLVNEKEILELKIYCNFLFESWSKLYNYYEDDNVDEYNELWNRQQLIMYDLCYNKEINLNKKVEEMKSNFEQFYLNFG